MGKNVNIREAVEAELAFDSMVSGTDITVVNAGGDIALNGTVSSYPHYLAAAAAAQRVDGVRKVHNHLKVVLPDDDYRDNVVLATAANNAVALTTTLTSGVEATVKNGNITLTGTVSTGFERTAAEATVAYLIGVRSVRNDIDVWSDVYPSDLINRVQGALNRNALIADDSDVVVKIDDRMVTLIGHVRNWAEHDAVLDAAWRTEGVFGVVDDLVITG